MSTDSEFMTGQCKGYSNDDGTKRHNINYAPRAVADNVGYTVAVLLTRVCVCCMSWIHINIIQFHKPNLQGTQSDIKVLQPKC